MSLSREDIEREIDILLEEGDPEKVHKIVRELTEEEVYRLQFEKFRFFEPNGKCEEFIKAVGEGNFIVLFSAANGVGKCKKITTPILMSDGSIKPLGDIKVGDYVMGHNYETGEATPAKVLGTSRAGVKPIYRFNFVDGGYTEASPEHSYPIKLRSGRKGKVKKMRVSEMLERGVKKGSVGSKLKFQSPKVVDFKQDNNLPIDPYLLGVLIGDGCLTGGKIRLSNPDQAIIDRVRHILEREEFRLSQQGESIDYNIIDPERRNNRLKDIIKELGLNVNSNNKFIPQIYKTASVEERKQLLAGLIDTDGSLKEWTTVSKQLSNDFRFLVMSLGGRANLKERNQVTNYSKGKNIKSYRVYWRFDYKLPLSRDDKQYISKRPPEYSNRIVESIEYIGDFETGDIFIEHSHHCYISDDWVSTGNTATSANIVAHLLWGKESENKWFDYPMFKDWPYPKRGRIVSDPTNLDKNLIPTLKEWFPEGRYKTSKGNKTYESIWKSDTGWEFDVMSYDQSPKEFESTTLGWVWFDEPPPKEIFIASVSRLRKGGIIFISETPLWAAWLYDHIIANPDQTLAEKGQRVYIEADVEAACKTHGIRGHLDHEHIERMIAEYNEEEKQARIYGKFQHLVGARFKRFSRNIHVIKPFNIDWNDYTVYEALDPHPRNPDAVVWIAVDRKGRKFVVDELYEKCQGGTKELAQRIKSKASQFRVQRRIIDPIADIEDQHTGHSLKQKLSRYGLNYIKASKTRALADSYIEDALAYETAVVDDAEEFIRAPELYIFDTCKRTIFEMEHYRWDEWKGKGSAMKNKKEKTVDKDDHTIEDIGRILVMEPKFVEPSRRLGLGEVEEPNYDPYA